MRHDCLPSLLGINGDKLNKIVFSEEKIFCAVPATAAKAGQKSLVPARQSRKRTKEGSLSYVLFESLFGFNSLQGPPLCSLNSLI
jgi:hypothetical protein